MPETIPANAASERSLRSRISGAGFAVKLQAWVESVANDGLEETRKIPGLHDEPLKGQRTGQRSIRLSRAYRAISTLTTTGVFKFVRIVKVTKHEY